MTLVVNLYGGPGTGKSTTAAALFAKLKLAGYNAELVTEFAKDVVWDDHMSLFSDQIWISVNQLRRVRRVLGKVDVAVVDSPILLGLHYDNMQTPGLAQLLLGQHRSMKTLDVFLRRVKKYNPKGRYQTEVEARKIDEQLEKMLYQLGEKVEYVTADDTAADAILKLIQA